MATYSILGTDRQTHKETVLEIDATSEADAAEVAMERGLQIKQIRAHTMAPTRPAEEPAAWTPKRPRDVADQVERGVFAGGAKLVVCVTWIILAASLVASTTGGIVLASACIGTVVFGLVMLIDRLRK